MSQKLESSVRAWAAEQIPPEWISERGIIIQRDGHAVRAGVNFPCIEVQSINQPELWCALTLPGNVLLFVSNEDRDLILDLLVGREAP